MLALRVCKLAPCCGWTTGWGGGVGGRAAGRWWVWRRQKGLALYCLLLVRVGANLATAFHLAVSVVSSYRVVFCFCFCFFCIPRTILIALAQRYQHQPMSAPSSGSWVPVRCSSSSDLLSSDNPNLSPLFPQPWGGSYFLQLLCLSYPSRPFVSLPYSHTCLNQFIRSHSLFFF